MAKLKPIITTQEKLNTIEIKKGQFICVKDSNSIYIDTDTERLEYTLPRVLNYLQSGNSISIGGSNTIQGDGCVVLGSGSTAYGSNTIALGSGINTHNSGVPVIGNGNVLPESVTNAIIIGNHDGNSLTEITNNCINIGFTNKITGKGLAYGQGLKVTKDSEIAIGKYNLSNDNIAFSIGNGIDDSNRSNIFTIYNDGKVESNSFIGASITNWQSNYLYKINELVIYNNILYQCNINHTSLETFEENKWNVLLSAKDDSFNFNDLSTAITTGTQTGITITADTENSRFNFEVTGIPTIAINSEGYWTINGEPGENPTKAQGEKGNDGISPTAEITASENGATITITDSSGTTTVDISNGIDGTDGISPHIDETTKHWYIGENDTGVAAEGKVEINTDCVVLYATLLADGWSNTAPYTQTVAITSISSNNVPVIDISLSDDNSLWEAEETAYSNLTKIETADGSITATCLKSKPASDFTIKMKIAGDISGVNVVTQSEFDELKSLVVSANDVLASVTGVIE